MTNSAHSNLAWILDDLVRVPDVVYALVLSADGLVVQKSTSLPYDPADSLAAGASSLHSVAAGLGRLFDSGAVQQVIIEYRERTLFVADAGRNARLAVLCEHSVDMGTVAYEMGRMVNRIGEYLGSEARTPASSNGQSGAGHA